MHIVFIPYGERSGVNRLLNEMEAQKHQLFMTKGKKIKMTWINGQIRNLPFGIVEYVVPKESLDRVLTTFNATVSAGTESNYGITFKKLVYPTMRKLLKLKKIPKYETKEQYLWTKVFVSIIVLGIREDGEIVGNYIDDRGWTHEALLTKGLNIY